jgi:hypothetical protein
MSQIQSAPINGNCEDFAKSPPTDPVISSAYQDGANTRNVQASAGENLQIGRAGEFEGTQNKYHDKKEPHDHKAEVYDGWGDDGLDDVVDDFDNEISPTENTQDHPKESAHMSSELVLFEKSSASPETDFALEMKYNPEDDIIETRKRWINPRPFRPYIKN